MKTDYINECNEHRIPEEDFLGTFCLRCFQAECTRSLSGSKFDQRTATWEDRLFTNIPRLDPSDPRYVPISSQKFLTLDTSRTPEIRGAWFDPLAVTEPAAPETPRIPAPAAIEPATESSTPAPENPSPETPPKTTPSGRLPSRMILANAQDQSGKMLEASTEAAPQTASRDPWATPERGPAENVIRPGGVVKLGGSGV